MDQTKLKSQGARRGEIGKHTLKLGSVIIKFDQIAAIMMAEDYFCPNDSDNLRKTQKLLPPLIFLGASLAVVGGVSWGLSSAEILGATQKSLFAGLAIGGVVLAGSMHAIKYILETFARRKQSFYRLMIETSGGTRFAIVDNQVKRLSGIREILYRKLETADPTVQAAFDFDKDYLQIYN